MEKSNWRCAAIDHGVTVFPTGRIGPCCKIAGDYLKPASELTNPDRFADLKTPTPPTACHACVSAEYQGRPSYRHMFNNMVTPAPGLQFVDIRNTNLCNLKCRYCGPHFSSSWAKELQRTIPIVSAALDLDTLITDSLQWMYFTGGEPLINGEHWALLDQLIATGRSQHIALSYNTNLTTLKYKDRDIGDIWSKFKRVDIRCSIDGVGATQQFVRSGSQWPDIEQNIQSLAGLPVNIVLAPVISILNIWDIKNLCDFASQHSLKMDPIVLVGPDYLALDVVPDSLQGPALRAVEPLAKHTDPNTYGHIKELIRNNQNQCLFTHTIAHVLLLDRLRGERLFDLLPFGDQAQQLILENHEYE